MEIQTGIDIHLGDCLEVMGDIPDGSVDMVMADLPYGTTACEWDSVIPLEPLWAHYKRIIKPRGAIVLTASQPFTTALIASNLDWFKYCWVWEKSLVGDVMNAKNKPLKAHEDICVFSPGTTANRSPRLMNYHPQGVKETFYQRKQSYRDPEKGPSPFHNPRPSHKAIKTQTLTNYPRSIIRFANPNQGTDQPTQKPVALMEYLIRTYTNEGELVLDNTMGSGTTGIACIRTGRRFIGIEKDPDIFETARRRLSGGKAQVTTIDGTAVKQARLF